ncbi:unnamed protein product, partial [Prorocentrum cordatum]
HPGEPAAVHGRRRRAPAVVGDVQERVRLRSALWARRQRRLRRDGHGVPQVLVRGLQRRQRARGRVWRGGRAGAEPVHVLDPSVPQLPARALPRVPGQRLRAILLRLPRHQDGRTGHVHQVAGHGDHHPLPAEVLAHGSAGASRVRHPRPRGRLGPRRPYHQQWLRHCRHDDLDEHFHQLHQRAAVAGRGPRHREGGAHAGRAGVLP